MLDDGADDDDDDDEKMRIWVANIFTFATFSCTILTFEAATQPHRQT